VSQRGGAGRVWSRSTESLESESESELESESPHSVVVSLKICRRARNSNLFGKGKPFCSCHTCWHFFWNCQSGGN